MDLTIPLATLVVLVALALVFDFMNGFHDAANSIATVVSTGVLRPHQAVIWAAFFNFVAIFIFHLKVAATVGKGIVDPDGDRPLRDLRRAGGRHRLEPDHLVLRHPVELLARADRRHDRRDARKSGHRAAARARAYVKTATFIVVSPLLGMTLGALLMIAVSWACLRGSPRRVDQWFRRLQLISSALYSIGHGSNDAQKTMGIIWLLLITAGMTTRDHLPYWVIVSCYIAIALGTLFGGWRIVKTMGQKITKLRPVGGFAAETGGAMTLFLASSFGIPVSTTHTITGAIVGIGAAQRTRAVRWGVAGNIVIAWLITMPAAAAMAAVAYYAGRMLLAP